MKNPVKTENDKATIVNIQRCSLQDGPGIRTTVFLKGCPLRCEWCDNPESQTQFAELGYRSSVCDGCGVCVEACDRGAISLTTDGIAINRKLWNACGKCLDLC